MGTRCGRCWMVAGLRVGGRCCGCGGRTGCLGPLTFSAPKGCPCCSPWATRGHRCWCARRTTGRWPPPCRTWKREAGEVPRGREGVDRLSGAVGGGVPAPDVAGWDPQPNTHVQVANRTRGQDGRWSALDGRQRTCRPRSPAPSPRPRSGTSCARSGCGSPCGTTVCASWPSTLESAARLLPDAGRDRDRPLGAGQSEPEHVSRAGLPARRSASAPAPSPRWGRAAR